MTTGPRPEGWTIRHRAWSWSVAWHITTPGGVVLGRAQVHAWTRRGARRAARRLGVIVTDVQIDRGYPRPDLL